MADDTGVSLLTAEVEDPSGYGRIIRDPRGAVAGIVEHADATPEQRLVREINVGRWRRPATGWARPAGRSNLPG